VCGLWARIRVGCVGCVVRMLIVGYYV